MSGQKVTDVLGIAAALVTILQVGKQVLDVGARARVSGVSVLTWHLAFFQSTGLLALSIEAQLLGAVAANGFVALAAAIIVIRLSRRRGRGIFLWNTVWIVLILTLISVSWWLIGGQAIGAISGSTAAVVFIPQALKSARTRSPEGISTLFLVAGTASSVLWVAYAGASGEPVLAIPSLFALVALSVTAVSTRGHG